MLRLKNSFSRRIPGLVGGLTFTLGFFNIVSNTVTRFREPTEKLNSYFLTFLNATGFTTTIFAGILLIILSRGLKRKKRRAWRLSVLMLAITLITEFLRFHTHPTQTVLTIALLIILLISKDQFKAKSDPTTRFRPINAFVFTTITFVLVGILTIYFRHSANLSKDATFSDVVLTVLAGFIWLKGPVELNSELSSSTLQISLGMFGIFMVALPISAYLRRVKEVDVSSELEKIEIKNLLNKYGNYDSLGYFATRNDKSIIWSRNRKAGIAYRIENGVILASGDPFGEFSNWSDAVEEFLRKADEFGWTIGVMGASEKGGKLWIEKVGLSAIEIGDEAVIEVEDFSLDGKGMSNVRQAVHRATREGLKSKIVLVSELDSAEKKIVAESAKKWRGNSIERGFSMSMDRFLGEIDDAALLALGYLNEELIGFQYFLPWGKNGYSLDRMQRSGHSIPGLNEMLIVSSIEYLKSRKMSSLSLNFAAFRSVIDRAEKINAGPILRTIRWLIQFSSGWFQVESLYRFNSKFQPIWQPRYLLHPGMAELPSVIWAALKAEKFLAGFGKRNFS